MWRGWALVEPLTLVVVIAYFLWTSVRMIRLGRRARAVYRMTSALLFLLVPYLLLRFAGLDWARWLMIPGIVLLFLPVFADRRRRRMPDETSRSGEDCF
jgi:hypothetical protein